MLHLDCKLMKWKDIATIAIKEAANCKPWYRTTPVFRFVQSGSARYFVFGGNKS